MEKKITNLVAWGEEPLVSWQKKKPSQALCISMGRAAGGGAGWCGKNWVVLTTSPLIASPPACPISCAGRDKSCRNVIVVITKVFKMYEKQKGLVTPPFSENYY